MATTLYVVRHGETDWNRERRVQGHTDIPLNDEGRRQALQLAKELSETQFDAAHSSDLSRAVETATIVVGTRPLVVAREPDLREKHFGTWEGLTDKVIHERFPEAKDGPWGDGETTAAMDRRIMETLTRIATSNPERSVLVVTHGGPIRALYRQLDLAPPAIPNCAVQTFVLANGKLMPPPAG
jgi:2,3-bisphosphoglycerate-dependent phosphoglycerate mutase